VAREAICPAVAGRDPMAAREAMQQHLDETLGPIAPDPSGGGPERMGADWPVSASASAQLQGIPV
jgi:hypothetical protein